MVSGSALKILLAVSKLKLTHHYVCMTIIFENELTWTIYREKFNYFDLVFCVCETLKPFLELIASIIARCLHLSKILLESIQVWFSVFYSLWQCGSKVFECHWFTWLFGYLVNCIVCLPNYWLLLVFIGGRRFRKLFGRVWPSLFWKVKCPVVDPLRKTIVPCDVGHVAYFVVIVRYGSLCILWNLLCVDMPHFMNNHVR